VIRSRNVPSDLFAASALGIDGKGEASFRLSRLTQTLGMLLVTNHCWREASALMFSVLHPLFPLMGRIRSAWHSSTFSFN